MKPSEKGREQELPRPAPPECRVYADFRDALYRLEAAAEGAISDCEDLEASPPILHLVEGLAKVVSSTVTRLPRPSAEG